MSDTPEPIGSILEQRARDLHQRIGGADEDEAGSQERRSNLEHLARECPRRFKGATFATLNLDGAQRDRLTEWASDPKGRNVLLAGTVGSGKTHAAIALAALMVGQSQRFTNVTFRTTVALLNELRPGYQPRPDRYEFMDRPAGDPWDDTPPDPRDPLRNAQRTDLLILDDLGVERGTEWVAEQVSEIIDCRWRNMLPTIATTNLTLGPEGTLKPMVGERAYDRLVGSDAVVIRLTGASKRRHAS